MDETAPGRPEKRSVTLQGHRTSLSLEPEFWAALKEITAARGISLTQLIAAIDRDRGARGLSGAIRVYVLAYYRSRRG